MATQVSTYPRRAAPRTQAQSHQMLAWLRTLGVACNNVLTGVAELNEAVGSSLGGQHEAHVGLVEALRALKLAVLARGGRT